MELHTGNHWHKYSFSGGDLILCEAKKPSAEIHLIQYSVEVLFFYFFVVVVLFSSFLFSVRKKLILEAGIIRVYSMKHLILFVYLMGIESTKTAFELLVKQVLEIQFDSCGIESQKHENPIFHNLQIT